MQINHEVCRLGNGTIHKNHNHNPKHEVAREQEEQPQASAWLCLLTRALRNEDQHQLLTEA